jgi:hypothetical protein
MVWGGYIKKGGRWKESIVKPESVVWVKVRENQKKEKV